jgi:7-carboxy-7-deazaguanine synthase
MPTLIEAPPATTRTAKAWLVEMFSAIQGEGMNVGTRQIFIRFLGCHIACAFCDTPATHTKLRQCRVEMTPGQRDFRSFDNPLTLSQVLELVDGLEAFAGLHDSISLTGGEPLQHVKTLLELIPLLKDRFKMYLETDGILHANLAQVVDQLDQIGMDIKIPSATLLQPYWDEHRQFLAIAARKEVFTKLVIAQSTTDAEIATAIELIKEVDASIPMILQPVTPYGIVRNPPTPEQVLHWQTMAKRELKQVRVIPQTHKMIGQI